MCLIIPPILQVEDNPNDPDLTRRALTRRKLINLIEVACDGDEALAFISRWESGMPMPALILLDLKLPRVSGLEVLRQIKGHLQFSTIPIVVLTSSAEDSDIREAYKFGVNSYIVKPLNFERFMEVAAQIEVYWCVMNTPPRPR
jgi:CheY-like chemotaxis protein